MSSSIRKLLIATSVAVSLVGFGGNAFAGTWTQQHPRRAEVNTRLANQNRRIHNQVREGELTKGQAAALHRDDHSIRTEERAMASQDGGHISKSEQHVLNQQENAVSKQIGH
jgi:hypothetical protein